MINLLEEKPTAQVSLDEEILNRLGYSQQVEQYFDMSSADLFDGVRFYSDLYRLDLALTFAQDSVKHFDPAGASQSMTAYVGELKAFVAVASPVWRVLEERFTQQYSRA